MSQSSSGAAHPSGKLLFEQLPFTGDPQSSHAPYWILPAVGGYETGYATGVKMAHTFLDFMCRCLHPGQYSFYLSRIILSFYVRIDAEGGLSALDAAQRSVQADSLRGQFFGFFNTISAELAADPAGGDISAEEDWLTEVDMAGSGASLDRIHAIINHAPPSYRNAHPTARMFWFLFGMYHGRLLHEKLNCVEPESFKAYLEEL